MSDIEIDVEAFGRRGAQLVKAIGSSSSPASLSSVDSILVLLGARQQDDIFMSKSGALHIWLLGYEFPATLIHLDKEKITFVTSASKAKLLEPLTKQKAVRVEIMKRPKDEEGGKKVFEEFAEKIATASNLGLFSKEKPTGKFTDEWETIWSSKKPSFLEETDVADGVASIWAAKDDGELKCHRLAARLSSHLVSNYFVDEMSRILDEGKKVGCEKLARRVENRLDDEDAWKKAKGIKEADTSLAEWCHLPVIQSGGAYDIKWSGQSSEGKLDGNESAGNVVIANLGVKYKSYCSWVGRTFCIDPHKNTQRQYATLLALQNELVDNVLRPGKTGAEVYEAAVDFVKKKDAKLAESLPKNLGFATGLEFRDSTFLISSKNSKPLKANMVICLALGFSDLPDEDPKRKADGKKYSLSAVDTVRINEEDAATILSEKIKSASDMMFFNNDDDSEKEDKHASPEKTVTAGGKVLRNRANAAALESLDQRIKDHQKELADAKHQEGLDKWAGEEGEGGKERGKTFKKFESYKKESNMPVPNKPGDVKIILDQRASTVLLPIYGFSVPFHINTIKNVSKSDEGEWTYLRFNFISPGQIAGKKEDVPFEDPEATFIKQMSFRSQDAFHFGELAKTITDMKKEATKKETEKKEMADVVQQDKLQLVKGRPSVLSDVYPRPALEGKRHPGDVEIHQNGIRFKSPYKEGHVIDLLFSNIRHLFYQSCEGELIAIIHIHLKAPIMVGKKKSKDVQFFREASDVTFDETGNKKRKYRTGDEDEIELEQEEKRRRHQLNKEFKSFANKIADASEGRITVDVPMRELGFSGVPFRTNVQILPTTDCIVHLTDPPFFVVTLADIEVAHLERVAYGLKNFDLVLVLSDFSKPPLHINSIPMTQLDSVKEFLDSVDICISEGPVNLNWSAIIKTIQEDPYDFFNEGGWGFLRSSNSDAGSSESESGSEFGDEEEAVAEVISSEEDASDDAGGSDFGDSDDDSGSDAEGDLSESGEDWDELERKAARADDKKGGESEDESDNKKRKKAGR